MAIILEEELRIIKEELVKRSSKISTAESCTAGNISKTLTSISGSSDYFNGSIIAYTNIVKVNVLGVDENLINTYTEVSDAVACDMSEKVKTIMNSEYSISTTGYADSEGYGTENNPPGTIYISLSTPTDTQVKRVELSGTRSQIIDKSTSIALDMLLEYFKNHQV